MKSIKSILIILFIFFQTETILSNENIFNVNNVKIVKNLNDSNEVIANKAIKRAFEELKNRILLQDDRKKLQYLKFTKIKELVSYYQVIVNDETELAENTQKLNYNIFFDRDKLHNLFYQNQISYSEINNKEIFLLPVLKKKNQYYIYNKNFFYDSWNLYSENELIEYILPIENIEIIQKINSNKNDLLDLDLRDLFKEYTKKNLALVIIEDSDSQTDKVFLKTFIANKEINKRLMIKKQNLSEKKFYLKIIKNTNAEITNLIKSQNLIDIRTPSFINAKLILSKKNNLVELNKRLKNIELIENIYVQKFNNKSVDLKIKYLGKLNKILRQFENEKIILQNLGDQWSFKIL